MKRIIYTLSSLVLLTANCVGQSLEGNWYECQKNGEYVEFSFSNDTILMKSNHYEFKGTFMNRNDTIIYHNPDMGWDYLFIINELNKDDILVTENVYNSDEDVVKHKLLRLSNNESSYEIRRSKCIDSRTNEERKLDSLRSLDLERRIHELELKLDSLRKADN